MDFSTKIFTLYKGSAALFYVCVEVYISRLVVQWSSIFVTIALWSKLSEWCKHYFSLLTWLTHEYKIEKKQSHWLKFFLNFLFHGWILYSVKWLNVWSLVCVSHFGSCWSRTPWWWHFLIWETCFGSNKCFQSTTHAFIMFHLVLIISLLTFKSNYPLKMQYENSYLVCSTSILVIRFCVCRKE